MSFCFLNFYHHYFFCFYLLAGLTDVIDGFIARKANSVSEFGSRLDTISDFIFFICLFIVLAINKPISFQFYFVIIFIGLIKILTLIIGYIENKKLFVCHNIINKIAGIVVFTIPVMILLINFEIALMIACSFGLVASFVEAIEVIKRKGKIVD